MDNGSPRADERFGTIPRMVQANARRFATREAVVDGAVRLTFADVERDMTRVAAALLASGVERGDRVALWAPNSASWIGAALGILAAGAWLVPVNTRFKGDEVAEILARTDARLLFTVDEFLGTDPLAMVRRVAPDLRATRDAVLLPGPGADDAPGWSDFLASGDGVTPATVDAVVAAGRPDDVSDLIFTSGTTGTPKGVMLRHGASLRGYEIFAAHFGLHEGDRYLVPTPFFHCFGYKAGWMIGLLCGATTYPLAVFDAESVLAMIESLGITHFPGPPTMFGALLDHPGREGRDLSTLRHAIVGAASVPEVLVHRMRDELGIDAVLSAYGLTENHALVSLTDADAPADVVATTVGRPIAEVEVRVVDDELRDVPDGDEGELLVRSPYLMSGYYEDPEATARVVVDGWLRTGDVGAFDDRGLLHITDRKKDLYIVGGFNVAPAEVEQALLGLEGVAQVAVVGVPDDYFGEVGCAFVVAASGASLTADAVVAYAARAPRELQGAAARGARDRAPGERDRQGAQGRAAAAGPAAARSGLTAGAALDRFREAQPALGATTRLVGHLVDATERHGRHVLGHVVAGHRGAVEPFDELATTVAVRAGAVATEGERLLTRAGREVDDRGERSLGLVHRRRGRGPGAHRVANAADGLGRGAHRARDRAQRRVGLTLELLGDATADRVRVDRAHPAVATDARDGPVGPHDPALGHELLAHAGDRLRRQAAARRDPPVGVLGVGDEQVTRGVAAFGEGGHPRVGEGCGHGRCPPPCLDGCSVWHRNQTIV